MTPAARIAAAAECLDRIAAGAAAEQVLTTWGRASRYAGSGDRAAVRDLVYQALRCRRSYGARGGGGEVATGRQLMLGLLRARGEVPGDVFTGAGHAPAPLAPAEAEAYAAAPDAGSLPETVALDCPGWLEQPLREAMGADFAGILAKMQTRAPVHLRVNLARATRNEAMAALAADGIAARAHELASATLEAIENAGKIRASKTYASGLVELQDAASQAVCEALPLKPGDRVLDYCAGGGGKTLALAARVPGARYTAHDALPQRMSDLPARAARAGAEVRLADTSEAEGGAPYDLVVADVPCSGSGTWARDPEAKWRLTPERLAALQATQAEILNNAAILVAKGGHLAYLTCSLLRAENEDAIAAFLEAHPAWRLASDRRISPLAGGDGFYMALLTRG